MDDDVTSKKGIYEYLLTNEERCLNIRAFSDSMKRAAYERQNGICPKCNQRFEIDAMEGDHITPCPSCLVIRHKYFDIGEFARIE